MPAVPPTASADHQLAPFRELLHSLCGKVRQGVAPDQDLPSQTLESVDRMSGTELRDHLLAIDPLDHLWVARVNQVTCFQLQQAQTLGAEAYAVSTMHISSSSIMPRLGQMLHGVRAELCCCCKGVMVSLLPQAMYD